MAGNNYSWKGVLIMKMKKFLLVILMLFVSSEAGAKLYVAEPLLVPQSPYAGITFYVYKPYNMPKDWYVTLDGYPVIKNPDGTWVYGTMEGPNLTATNYVVGSVVPSMAGITKYISDIQVSELRKLPDNDMIQVQQKAYTRSQMAQGQTHSTYIPGWTFNPSFMAIGNWKGTVDRIGVLNDPVVPAAWSGQHPKVIYVWTGSLWHQVNRGESQSAKNALRHEYANIKRLVRESGFKWYQQDMPILAQQAKAWGYYWLGEVSITR